MRERERQRWCLGIDRCVEELNASAENPKKKCVQVRAAVAGLRDSKAEETLLPMLLFSLCINSFRLLFWMEWIWISLGAWNFFDCGVSVPWFFLSFSVNSYYWFVAIAAVYLNKGEHRLSGLKDWLRIDAVYGWLAGCLFFRPRSLRLGVASCLS